MSWLPRYFSSVLGLSWSQLGFAAVVPYVAKLLFSTCWSAVADWLMAKEHMSRLAVRKLGMVICFAGPSFFLAIISAGGVGGIGGALACVTMAVGLNGASDSGFWANIIDVAPRQSGEVMGISNTFGTLPGIFGNVITGWVLQTTGSWSLVFGMVIVNYVFGLVVYLKWASGNVLFDDNI